ncbi:TadE family protein [Planctomycetaceae bacterium SH139]
MNGKSRTQTTRKKRDGQALIEFAIISFVLTAMLAGFLGIIVMGLGSFQNNIATESAGRLLDGHEVFIKKNFFDHFGDALDPDYLDPNTNDFEDITARQVYRFLNEYSFDQDEPDRRLYDESRLILSRDDWSNRLDLDLPVINQSLLGQYVFDPDLEIAGQDEQGGYRFPGAVVMNENVDPPTRTVVIPLLPGPEGVSGIERTFHVTSTNPTEFYPVSQDWVAPVVIGKEPDGDGFHFRVIMFHPSQPASMMNIEVTKDVNGNIRSQIPVVADDDAVDAAIGDPPDGYVLAPATSFNPLYGASPSRGEFGLGESFGFSQEVVGGELVAFFAKVRPFRAVFETSSLFRTGASLNPIFVKYEYEEDGTPGDLEAEPTNVHNPTDTAISPFANYEEVHNDQALRFDQQVIDRAAEVRRRFIVDDTLIDSMDPSPSDPSNDFVRHVLWLQPNDGGVWRVSVSAELETDGSPWEEDHNLQLRLYLNGEYRHLIASHDVTLFQSMPPNNTDSILVAGDALITAEAGDVLQVRVFIDQPTSPPSYAVRLSGERETNWVTFERVGD